MASKRDEIVVLVTAAEGRQAKAIATHIVEAKLAACVNIVGPIRSIYRWQGKVRNEAEILLLAKTRRRLFRNLERMVKRLHSYENPEIIAIPIEEGSAAYLKWLIESTEK